MNQSLDANSPNRIERLIEQMLDASLTDQEHRELLEILQREPSACAYFLEQSMLHALLRERSEAAQERPLSSKLFGVRPEELSQLVSLTAAAPTAELDAIELDACDFGDCLVDDSEQGKLPQSENTSDHSAPAAPIDDGLGDELGRPDSDATWARWWKPGSFGALLSVSLVFSLWFWWGGDARRNAPQVPVAQNRDRGSTDSEVVLASRSAYVARIVKASTDCVWGELAAPAEFLLRVRAGDPMHVAAGLVEMEFYSGARVILHGPAVFTPTGPASGRLESGRLTGEVANGDFRLMTPTAEVIDLGTSFGVVADADVGTDVVVFDGRVQVVSMRDGIGNGESLDMTEGMAARFRSDGTTEYGLKTDATQFARRIAPSAGERNPDEICLVDVLAGGNGLGAHLAGAIDPQTGQRDFGEEGRKSRHFARWTDGAFHAATWHPLIDGVFIPWSEGRSVQIDTRGGKIDTPHCTGTTHGSIWARRKESIHETDTGPDIDFWGTRTVKGIVERLKGVETGLVGMHSNVGITIDLRMLRMVHRRAPTEFCTSVANIENSADWAPHERPTPEVKTLTADFRVFVDGQLRASHLGFDRHVGALPIQVALHDDDRFLTILVTDGDGEMRFDHVVLIDPTIALKKE